MHSASVAVRAVVDFYRRAERESELDQRILIFLIVHDKNFIRIYGHYA